MAFILSKSQFDFRVPEVPIDTSETNKVLQRYSSVRFPDFNDITERNCYFGLGKTLMEFEGAVADFKDRIQKDVKDFDELFGPLEEAKLQLESVWSTVNFMLLVTDKLDNDRFVKLHQRAERALLSRFDSKTVLEHLLKIKANSDKDEHKHMLDRYINECKHIGHALPEKKYEELQLNWMKKLTRSRTDYNYRMVRNNERYQHTIQIPDIVKDFPIDVLRAIAADSTEPSKSPWTITMHPYIFKQFMAYCPDRNLRYAAHMAEITRGDTHVDSSTSVRKFIKEIKQFRLDQASTLGYKNYAEMSMATKMAGNIDSVMALINNLTGKAKEGQEKDLESLQAYAESRLFTGDIEAYDIEYFERKQRRSILGHSDEDLRDFFPLPKVTQGCFDLFSKLFNIEVSEVQEEYSTWHTDVKLFQVKDLSDSKKSVLGHFYLDLFIRDEKGYIGSDKGWYVPLRNRSKIGPCQPLGALVMSLAPPNYGKPSLMNFFEAKEFLRVMGNVLQHILSRNEYSDNCGKLGMEWDALDFVGYFMAEWIYHPDVINLISGHWSTNDPLSEEVVHHLSSTIKHQMQGYKLCDDLFKASFDMSFYSDVGGYYQEIHDNLRKQYKLLPKIKGDVAPINYTLVFLTHTHLYYEFSLESIHHFPLQ